MIFTYLHNGHVDSNIVSKLIIGICLANIYLFKKTRFENFKFHNFNSLGINMQNTSCVMNSNPMVGPINNFYKLGVMFFM